MQTSFRKILLLTALIGAIGVAGSFYSQYVLKQNPCPLCIFQRMGIIGMTVLALLGAMGQWRRLSARLGVAMLVSAPALFGLGVALRHVYLQHLPPAEVPACGPGLNFMVKTLPFSDMLSKVLTGSGECAQVQKFMGLALPYWSAMLFGAGLIVLWAGFLRTRRVGVYGSSR